MRLDGKRVKGRLIEANVDELVVESKPPIPLRAVRCVRFPGLGMSRIRHGTGIAIDIVGGSMATGMLGSKAAARGQDVLYVLRNGPGRSACGE
jgi:hypothetical protein